MILQDELMTGCGDGRFMGRWYGAPTIVSTSAAPINCEYNYYNISLYKA